MATFNERREPTSRKYVGEEGIMMLNWSKTLQTFWLQFSIFALEKELKISIFRVFLPLTDTLVATFNETRAPTSKKYAGELRYNDAKSIKSILKLFVALVRFCLDKQHEYLNFQSIFSSNRSFGGYFQWKRCTNFQKICCWTRSNDAKFIKSIWDFLVALLRFYFRKTT